jgi:hypothetical protein
MSPRFMMTAALAATLAAPCAAFAKDCKRVSGPFSAVPPASCASPVGICTHGQLTGGLTATYDFVADTQVVVFPTAELTGHSTITIDKGGAVLLGEDTSTLSLLTGDFTTTVHIVGGTHQYKRAGGTIVAVGVFDFATGATVGTYSGRICKKSEGEADGVD